jgi:hypothetical protein
MSSTIKLSSEVTGGEMKKKEKLHEDLALAARTMVRFSCKINFLVGHLSSLRQGDKAIT